MPFPAAYDGSVGALVCPVQTEIYGGKFMAFFNSAVTTLQTIVVGLGGALCVWGGINLLEGYGQDNPASNAHVR